ncbi:hypothetical protein ACS5NO_12410 [Larkinella sp. GY13]|uniref:hypothetical protein n=1 Tax=Larkinella sp. GY13 TaxID=3453720 RepID=UPI003EEE209C
MKVLHTFKYLSLLAVVGFWGCSSTKQTAQNAGEFDDLYGSSSDAAVISSPQKEKRLASRQSTQRFNNGTLNSDPEYYNEQTAAQYSDDEYYSEVSARKVTRGISPDPGWNTDNAYTDGFSNGYNMAMMNSGWNRWGWNSPFYGGLSLGIGMGMMSPWGFNRFYSPFYSPFGYSPFGFGGGYAYSPFGYGGGFYDSFYSPFGYGYNNFYSPYGFGGYGRNVLVVNNYNNIGASRNATYGARGGSSRDRYNGDFVNTPRSYNNNNGGRRSGELNAANNNTYYSRPNTSGSTNNGTYGAGRANSRGSDYYYGGSSTSGRASANNAATPSYSAPSNSDYYAAPRSNSRGSYTPSPSSSVNSGSRYSAPQQSRSYQAPTRSYQSAPTRSYEAPTQRSYSPPSQPSYSAPSGGGGSRGGSSGGGGGYSGGGGSRGPR